MVHTRKIRRPLQRLRSLSVVNEDATTTQQQRIQQSIYHVLSRTLKTHILSRMYSNSTDVSAQ